jgi:maltose-binding protein MalE
LKAALPLARLFVLLLLAGLLAACGIGQPATPTPPASPTATSLPASPTATPLPTATPAPSPTPQPDTLTLWTDETGAALDTVRALAQDFSTQSTISTTVVAHPAGTLRVALLAAELVDEPPPDLLLSNQDTLAELLVDGQLQPVGEWADTRDSIPALVSGATHDSRLWAVPVAARHSLLLFYNQTLVQQPPTTTDGLIVQSRAFEDTNHAGLVAGWNRSRWLLAWLHGVGGALTSADGQPSLDTPQMIAALNLHRELYMAAPSDQQSYRAGQALFAAGEVALAIDGDWALPTYEAAAPLALGVAPMPRVPATGRIAAPPPAGIYLMVQRSLGGEELLQARAFADYLTTPAVQLRLAQTLRWLPANQAILTDPAITSDPVLAAAAIQAGETRGLPPTQAAQCALWALEADLDDLLAGNIDQEAAAAAMQQQAEWCISR